MNKEELMARGIDEEVAMEILGEREEIKREYEEKIARCMRDNEIDIALRESGAKNIEIVKRLIDEGDNFKEQIEALKKSEETRFLFEEKKSFTPFRSAERLPDTTKDDYQAKLTRARNEKNTLEAIRIKQKAASEGIMLL